MFGSLGHILDKKEERDKEKERCLFQWTIVPYNLIKRYTSSIFFSSLKPLTTLCDELKIVGWTNKGGQRDTFLATLAKNLHHSHLGFRFMMFAAGNFIFALFILANCVSGTLSSHPFGPTKFIMYMVLWCWSWSSSASWQFASPSFARTSCSMLRTTDGECDCGTSLFQHLIIICERSD